MSDQVTRRSFAAESAREELDRSLNEQGVSQEVLQEAMAAAGRVLEQAGAPAVVEDLRILHTRQAGTCRCAEYETLYLPVLICDNTGCRTEYRTTRRCVRWTCE